MNYQELVSEVLSCRSVNEIIDLLLAYATEIYEIGCMAGSSVYPRA